jgi:hypothetical protein
MRKLLLVTAVALALAGSASAQTLDTDGLTPEQLHQVQVQIDQTKQTAAAQAPSQQAQKLSEYAQIGKGVAEAVGEAAKQLSVSVNDFAKTPVGDLTIKLIVFKVLEHRIFSTLFGLLWMLIFTPIWLHFTLKLWRGPVTIEFYENGKRKSVRRDPPSMSDTYAGWRIVSGVAGIAGVAVGLMLFSV